ATTVIDANGWQGLQLWRDGFFFAISRFRPLGRGGGHGRRLEFLADGVHTQRDAQREQQNQQQTQAPARQNTYMAIGRRSAGLLGSITPVRRKEGSNRSENDLQR